MANFIESPSVKGVVNEVIDIIPAHDHLKKGRPNIVCLIREGDWLSKGKVIYAKVFKADPKVRTVNGIDVFLVVNETVWQNIDEKTRRALIDHELCHIAWDCTSNGDLKVDGEGRPVWSIVGHDYEDFIGVVKRNGMWIHEVKRFFKGTADQVQLGLFDTASVEAETNEPASVEAQFDISFDGNGMPIFRRLEE